MLCSLWAARRGLLVTGVFFVLTAMILTGARAQIYGPRLLIQEDITGAYNDDGTVKTAAAKTGQFKIAVPNDDDVLQYIRVDLDSGYDAWTNIQNNTGAYHDVAVSSTNPPNWGWQLLYVNTTNNDADTGYVMNDSDQAPTINLSVYYSNERGGYHLYDEANIDDPDNNITMVFSLTNPSASRDLVGITAYIYLTRDTGPGTEDVDIIDIKSVQSGSANRYDSEPDGEYDRITWSGVNVPAGSTVNMTAVLNITSGYHINSDSVDLDSGAPGPNAGEGLNATYSNTSYLFSDVTVSDKFTRGPIRQGVDLSSNAGTWFARGFIRNMGDADSGHNLTYNVTEWRLYEINPSTGAPYSSANQTGEFNKTAGASEIGPDDGRIYTNNDSRSSNTTLYNTSSGTKPYIAIYFYWEVIWNSTDDEVNLSCINTTLDLPTLYLLDLVGVKSASGTISPNVGNENITINDTITNVGHNNTVPGFVQVLSYVPSNTTGASPEWRGSGWDIQDDVEIYLNNTYRLKNDTNCVLEITQPTESADGLVNISVYDLPNCEFWGTSNKVGHTFDEGDNLNISFRVTSDVEMTTGDVYDFWGIGQLTSISDTMDREYFNNQSVTVSGKRVIGYKDLIAYTPSTPTLINSTIYLEVQDSVGSGIDGIKFMDYVPAGTISYTDYVNNVTVRLYNGTGPHVLVYGLDYNITINGTGQLPDGLYVDMFEFVNESTQSGWNLTNGWWIEVKYQVNFTTPGTYVMPVMIAAFDPDTGVSLATALYGVIKIVIPEPNIPLTINEGELRQSETVLVGKPAVWNKAFDVYNPNPRRVGARFETVVFDDATDGYVSYFDESGRRVEESVGFATDGQGRRVMYWESSVNAFETRNYDVSVLTPPVLEIDRDIEVLEQLPEKKVRLKMDVYLKSFAQENYENVILNLPIAYQNVEEVRDGFGNRLPFTGGMETSSITVDRMDAGLLKTVTVIYQESYPTIIITPDRDRYNLNSPVSLEILVINGGEKIDYPYLEIEIYTPGMDVIFTNIERLEDMEPLEKSELYEKFVIPASAPSGMYIASARFREDFAVLASATGNFYVMGVSGGIPEALEILMIVLVSLILVYFSFRRLREVRGSRRPQAYGGI
jgi:hypothetical protein